MRGWRRSRASIGYAQRAFRTYALKFDARCILNSSWIERCCCPDAVDHAEPISLGHARFVVSASSPCVDHLGTAHRISTLCVILGSHLSHSHPHQRYLWISSRHLHTASTLSHGPNASLVVECTACTQQYLFNIGDPPHLRSGAYYTGMTQTRKLTVTHLGMGTSRDEHR